MDHENSFIEENIESDLKNEWLKKVLVVLVAVTVLGGTYYLTGRTDKKNSIAKQKSAVEQDLHVLQKPTVKKPKIINSNKIVSQNKTVLKKTLISQNSKQTVFKSDKIRPSNKALVAKYALLAAGKFDPFCGSAEKPVAPLKSFLPKYIGRSPITNLPSLSNLPSISSLPELNAPNLGRIKTPNAVTQSYPEVKGFIGNKVIISINGISEALKANESFQNIKVLKVDPETMTVKYVQDKEVITKNIQSLN